MLFLHRAGGKGSILVVAHHGHLAGLFLHMAVGFWHTVKAAGNVIIATHVLHQVFGHSGQAVGILNVFIVIVCVQKCRVLPLADQRDSRFVQMQFIHSALLQAAQAAFAGKLGGAAAPPVPAQPAHSGYTQNLGAAPAEPNTSAFVSDIANAINSGEPAGDTLRYEDAAARLTASLAEDAAAARTHTHIPTAAEVRQAAARFAGRAEDESEDNAVSPFETAEIPVPHSREYERAEDAPAVRAELAKKLTQATVACLMSGVAAAVMIVLAVLPVRPAALGARHGLPFFRR